MEERFKFRHVNEITGAFVLLILALLIAAVVWTGRSQRWFKSSVTLRITLPRDRRRGHPGGFGGIFSWHTCRVGFRCHRGHDGADGSPGAKIRRDFFRFVRADSSAVVKRKFRRGRRFVF